jgi:hypothetical protein
MFAVVGVSPAQHQMSAVVGALTRPAALGDYSPTSYIPFGARYPGNFSLNFLRVMKHK